MLCGAHAPCDGSCPKTKGAAQPNCLCRLAPPPGGSREHSIWARKSKTAVQETHEAASNSRREVRAPPMGTDNCQTATDAHLPVQNSRFSPATPCSSFA